MSKLGVEVLLVVLGYRRDKREKTKKTMHGTVALLGT